MEEKNIENMEERPKMNENNQNQTEKKKMPVAFKIALVILSCLIIFGVKIDFGHESVEML